MNDTVKNLIREKCHRLDYNSSSVERSNITPTRKKSWKHVTVKFLSLNPLIWRNFCVRKWWLERHSVEKREFHCHANFFRPINYRVKSFSEKILSRNFCEKMVAVKFRNFHTVSEISREPHTLWNLLYPKIFPSNHL